LENFFHLQTRLRDRSWGDREWRDEKVGSQFKRAVGGCGMGFVLALGGLLFRVERPKETDR
jgi:hypothetical protein